MLTNKSIVRSTGIISLGTLCSRLLGFIRDIVIARLFGIYVYAQAFVVAFKIPNLFRDLVGEGATNAAFVPVFSEYTVKHTRQEFWELANVVLNLLLIVVGTITILGIIFSGTLVRLIAPGFVLDPYKLAVTIKLTRTIFPYLLLISLTAYAIGILHSLKHFSIPAFAPCLLNISIIVFALMFGERIKGLATGILVGGFLQLLVQIPVLYQKGFRFQFPKRFRHPAAKAIGLLMVPRLFSSAIYQLNNFLDSIFGSLASIVGEGGVAALYFAYRLILFPIGIFSNALSQAILPTLSIQALEDNYDNLKQTLSFALRVTFLVMIPSSIGLMVLSRPIIAALFGGGRFDLYSIETTANVLFFYSIGLFSYGLTKILQSCFFALKDTWTPAKVSFFALIVNIILNVILMFPLKLNGLALATSISGINTCLILFFILKTRLKDFDLKPILSSFLRILIAGLCMGMVCYSLSKNNIALDVSILDRIINLGIPILAGLISYVIFCFIFRVPEIQELWQWLVKRKRN
ncbi:MAG: murein biosynthesis integral membrane protein MurJ [Candidatus Omnitrophica bacterium]|nr:murein biosynthesis integral membrane protein MurJ [Candidatus Omnitrophota bacterium]MBU4473484.1 murein biosynthesis integral membrane protein MurJ [Candidatus Omnitrophota bacterium]MCG2706921.1 murein biosynthesis integral membrane protein MurJ [Candidatus Omnitrophota bacterium]